MTGAGDGSVQVWDTANPQGPLQVLKEHTQEVGALLLVPLTSSLPRFGPASASLGRAGLDRKEPVPLEARVPARVFLLRT